LLKDTLPTIEDIQWKVQTNILSVQKEKFEDFIWITSIPSGNLCFRCFVLNLIEVRKLRQRKKFKISSEYPIFNLKEKFQDFI
jgi:hypothetical protein